MKKIFVFINGGVPGFFQVVALAEDGTALSGHLSSNEYWAKHDMGIGSDWRHEHYDEHYGAGNWELEWIESDDRDSHAGLREAYRLNQIQGQEAEDGVK